MPNEVAYLVLFAWPLVCILVYQSTDALTATNVTLIGGFLLLPQGTSVDLPFIPPLDKGSLSALTALVMCFVKGETPLLPLPPSGTVKVLVVVMIISPVLSVMNNPEPVIREDGIISGLGMHDAFSALVRGYLEITPFILATRLVRTPSDVQRVLRHLLVGGLCISLPAFFEIRMSPQLHTWVYGFFPHSFLQQMRFDGFRPVVFTNHGLTLANFIALNTGAAAMAVKTEMRIAGLPPILTLLYLIALLILCKSMGPAVLGLTMVVCILLVPPHRVATVVMVLALITATYPILKLLGWFPTWQLVDMVAGYSPERAQSLGFRFKHEGALLERAMEKPLLGWGGWGRNRLSDSVTDGYWIITFGSGGMVGFGAVYGLFLVMRNRVQRQLADLTDNSDRVAVAAAGLIAVMIGVNTIPNSGMHNVAWYLIGVALALNLEPNRQQIRVPEHYVPNRSSLR